MQSLRRTVVTLCATAGLTLGIAAFPAPASAEAPPTSTAARSGAANATGYPTLTGVRWSQHDTFDRVVFDFTGGTPGYQVGYGTLRGQGTGDAIAIAGSADLVATFSTARAHDDAGRPTYPLKTLDPRLAMLLQVKWGGDFEGYVGVGLGLRDRVGFRVLTLSSPARLVIDVSHFRRSAFSRAGTAPDVAVTGQRAATHTGWDRLVFDVSGSRAPALAVRYDEGTSLLLVRLSGVGSSSAAPHASYAGASPVTYGFPGIDRVRLASIGAGTMQFRVSTHQRHGFRVTVVPNPTRVIVDVSH